MKIGKARSAKRAKFRKPTRGGGRRGSKYDDAIAAICALEVDQFVDIELPEGEELAKFRATWAQMLSSKVRPALMELEGVTSRVQLSKDFEAAYLEDTEDRIAIVCKENGYTEEDEKRDKTRTKKAQKTRKSKPAEATVEETEVEADDEDDDIDF